MTILNIIGHSQIPIISTIFFPDIFFKIIFCVLKVLFQNEHWVHGEKVQGAKISCLSSFKFPLLLPQLFRSVFLVQGHHCTVLQEWRAICYFVLKMEKLFFCANLVALFLKTHRILAGRGRWRRTRPRDKGSLRCRCETSSLARRLESSRLLS